MFKAISCAFWGLFHWQLLEQEFSGGEKNDCQKLVLSKWVRLWDKDSMKTFDESAFKIEGSDLGFHKYRSYYFG